MIKYFKFLLSKKFIYNLIAIALVWIIIVFGTQYYLKSHTNFGQKIEVPSLYKIHYDELGELMKSKGLEYEIVDSIYMDGWPKGTVCWQYPMPTDSTKEFVKTGRIIQVSIIPNNPKMIVIPNVKDKSKRMAESLLESIGLRTKISYKPSNVGPGFVMEQLFNGKPVKENQSIPKGSVVEIVVAKGNGGAMTQLPNLVGLTISQAKTRLLNLNISIHPECPNCSDIETAIIISQSPVGGEDAKVAAGSIVTVWAEN